MSWISSISHEYQFLDSLAKFKSKLAMVKTVLGTTMYTKVSKIFSSMQCCTTKWAKCYKKSVMDLEHTTTSPGESMNKSMKYYSKRPMAGMNLDKSAKTMLNHSEHFDQKRDNHNAKQLNSRTVDIFMPEQNLLTKYCQEYSNAIWNHVSDYYCVRDKPGEYLICHKNTFVCDENAPLIDLKRKGIPKYANVYRVRILYAGGTTVKCMHCKQRSRKGILCVHILAAVQMCHPKMFHPRYLKAYNLRLYLENKRIAEHINSLLAWNRDLLFCDCSDISGLLDLPPFVGIEYRGGSTDAVYANMVALEQMHHSKQVLLRGQAIPVDFFSSPEIGFDHDFDYNSEAGDIEMGLAPKKIGKAMKENLIHYCSRLGKMQRRL